MNKANTEKQKIQGLLQEQHGEISRLIWSAIEYSTTKPQVLLIYV